jgi:hypothetical protein
MAKDTLVTALRSPRDGYRIHVLYSPSEGLLQMETLTQPGKVDYRDQKPGDEETYRSAIRSVVRGGYEVLSSDLEDLHCFGSKPAA